jgi:hypothetical protein
MSLDKTALWGASQIVLFAKYNLNDQVKKDEIGKLCSTNEDKRNALKVRRKH